ncbi:MAG: hypothetical protein H0U76_15910 [Ktedonobacteraceae bacterium]|nr:hypothetical protein [Ktedonobacteraceae bacterium]
MRQVELVDWLLDQDATLVHAWLHRVWEGLQDIPKDFKWEHLAAAADVLARSGRGPNYYSQPDLEWAKVAIALYQYLIDISDLTEHPTLEERMMYLRAYFIMNFGVIRGDPILDVNQIVKWFFQNLYLSSIEAEKRLVSFKELEYTEIVKLRYIKNRLTILQFLSSRDLLPPNQELDRWLALREKLP